MSKFINHFSHNKKVEIDKADLYDCKQKKDEALRKYLKRFNEMKVSVPDCKEKVAIKAFIKGLIPDAKLHADLMSKTPRTFAEVRRKAEGAMIYEEDLAKRKSTGNKEDIKKKTPRREYERRGRHSPVRREDIRRNPIRETRAMNVRSAPYTRGAVPSRESQPQEYIPYDLAIPPKEIVAVLKEMGDTVRFPAKLPLDVPTDMSRYCDFHQDYGHTTD